MKEGNKHIVESFATGEIFNFFGEFVASIADFLGGIFGDAVTTYIKNEWEEIKASERPELYVLDSIVGSFFSIAIIFGFVWMWKKRILSNLEKFK
tara:strand:+ start:748 stop:1032 length:285 start_codon:yes stop_codon:yes gene_type:complete